MLSRLMLLTLCLFTYAGISMAAFVPKEGFQNKETTSTDNKKSFKPEFNYDEFLSLTPKAYRELTGKKMSLKDKISLKVTQKMIRKHQNAAAEGGTLPQWAYVVLSIFALGWLAIGVKSNWQGNDWWISLLLYFVFYFPGLIYSLVVMKKYY